MKNWKVSSGQISVFPAPTSSTSSISILDLFKRVWDSDPDTFQKSLNPLMPAMARALLRGISVGCSSTQTRIDFSLTPAPPSADVPRTSVPQIENANHFRREMIRVIGGLSGLDVIGMCTRIALNIQVQSQENSLEEANQSVIQALPDRYRVAISGEEDFVMQINQPFTSLNVPGVNLNSITKWSVDQIHIINFSFPLGAGIRKFGPDSLPGNQIASPIFAAGINLDINSRPTNQLISPDQQQTLLGEAFESAKQQFASHNTQIQGFSNV